MEKRFAGFIYQPLISNFTFSLNHIVRGSKVTEIAHPGTIVTIFMSCFTTGDPGKEHRTNRPPPTGKVQERSKGDTTSHLPEFSVASILAEQCVHHLEGPLSQNDWPKQPGKKSHYHKT